MTAAAPSICYGLVVDLRHPNAERLAAAYPRVASALQAARCEGMVYVVVTGYLRDPAGRVATWGCRRPEDLKTAVRRLRDLPSTPATTWKAWVLETDAAARRVARSLGLDP